MPPSPITVETLDRNLWSLSGTLRNFYRALQVVGARPLLTLLRNRGQRLCPLFSIYEVIHSGCPASLRPLSLVTVDLPYSFLWLSRLGLSLLKWLERPSFRRLKLWPQPLPELVPLLCLSPTDTSVSGRSGLGRNLWSLLEPIANFCSAVQLVGQYLDEAGSQIYVNILS